METETKIDAVRVDVKCSKCSEGVMRYDKNEGKLASNPIQYVHECTDCDHRANYLKMYPSVRLKEMA